MTVYDEGQFQDIFCRNFYRNVHMRFESFLSVL